MKKRLFITLAVVLILLTTLSWPAVATEDEENVTASVTVNEPEIVSITLTDVGAAGIQFGPVLPSDTETYGDVAQSDGTPAIEVVVEPGTNVNVDISIMGSTLDTLALANWQYSKLFDQVGIASLTGSYVEVYDDVGDGSYHFYHWITVPVGTTGGSYSATVNYKASTHV